MCRSNSDPLWLRVECLGSDGATNWAWILEQQQNKDKVTLDDEVVCFLLQYCYAASRSLLLTAPLSLYFVVSCCRELIC